MNIDLGIIDRISGKGIAPPSASLYPNPSQKQPADQTLTEASLQSAQRQAPTSLMQSYINPCISAFGATFGLSSLVLSAIMAKAGPMVFLGSICLAIFVNYVSFIVLLKLAEKHRFTSFMQVSDLFDSGAAKTVFKLIYFAMNFGILLSACLVFNSLMTQIFRQFGVANQMLSSPASYFWAVALHILFIPLLLKRRLSELNFFAVLTLFACFYFTTFLVVQALGSHPSLDQLAAEATRVEWAEIPRCYSILFFVFSLQINLFSLYHELPRPSIEAFKPVLFTNFSFLTLVYLTIAIAGFVCFSGQLPRLVESEIILKMFDNSNKVVLLASVLMIVTAANTFLYTFKPTKDIILDFLAADDEGAETASVVSVNETPRQKYLNIIVTLGLTFASLGFATFIVVFKISFVRIIDVLADVFMPILFVFIPLSLYSRDRINPAVVLALVISAVCYFGFFAFQFAGL